MNPLAIFKLWQFYNKFMKLWASGGTMNPTKFAQLGALIAQALASLGAAHLIASTLQSGGWFVWALAVLNVLLTIGHALLPTLVPQPDALPSTTEAQKIGISSLNKSASIILLALLVCGMAHAQTTTTTTSTGFTASTDAVGVYYNSAWSVGSHITESFDLMDWGTTKANHLFVQGNELQAPTPGLNLYTGGFEYQPNVGSLFSKTNIPANTLQLFVNGSSGVGTAGNGPNHVSFLVGGGVRYNFNSSLTWNSLQVSYVRLGSQSFPIISSGLKFIFGPKATTTVTSAAVAK